MLGCQYFFSTSHLIAFKLLNKALYSDNTKQIAWKVNIKSYIIIQN